MSTGHSSISISSRVSAAAAVAPVPVRLGRRRVYILPTREGLLFAVMLVVMLLGSVNYNNSLGYMLTFLLGSLALVSILHTWRSLAGLTVRAGRVQPVFAGGLARFSVCLDNRAQPARHALTLRRHQAAPDDRVCTRLAANQTRCVELAVPAPVRGWLPLGRVVLASRYPLGLFRAWANLDLGAKALVYPAPRGRRGLPPSLLAAQRESGVQGSGGDDFAGFRDYLPGDSPRRVHWKAAARGQGMPVKLFGGGGACDLELRWQDVQGAPEARLAQLCRWVLDAERQGHRYALAIPGTRIGPASGEAHLHRCLRALALFGVERGSQASGAGGSGARSRAR